MLCTTIGFAPVGSASNPYRLPERVDVTPGSCTPGAQTRTTLTDYDADGTYAAKTTDPEGHVTERLVEPGFGVVYKETDVNSGGIRLDTTSQYDGFGRLVNVTRPDGTWTSVTRDGPTTCAPYGVCTTTQTSAGGKQIERADKLGQVVRAVTSGLSGDVWTDVEYDDRGRVAATLQPRYVTGPAYYAARYTYDTADRVTKVCQHDATKCKTTTYNGAITTTLDEDGKKRVTQLDAAGRLASSTIYPTSSTPAKTLYAYGPFDTLTAVIDAKANIVTMAYDALGRQRTVTDADLGWRAMDYDAFGQLVTLRDPKGQVTMMTYDRLGRARTRMAPDGTDEFTYDTSGGAGLGRLAYRSRGGVSTSFSYNALGRPQLESWTIDGSVFDYELAYDAQGRLDTLKYPNMPGRTDRFTIKQVYDAFDHLQYVKDVSTTTAKTLWTATAMDAVGHVTGESLGNGRTTTHTYTPDTGRPLRVTTPSFHDVEYAYSAGGNLLSRTDYRNSATAALATHTESFTYDGANRLLSATVAGRTPSTYSYIYDAIGNLTSATDQPSCTGLVYGGTHRLTSATCWDTSYSHQYDANGNETYTVAPDYREQTWTSFDKVLELGSRHGRMRYTYDADHRRVKKLRVAGALSFAPMPETPAFNDTLSAVWDTTFYPGDLYEKRLISNTTTIEHVFYVRAGGRTIAQVVRTGSATQDAWLYYHADFQGTPERFTGANGLLAAAASYDAWGMRRNPDWTSTATFSAPAKTRIGYTGHSHDDEVGGGVIDMGGRTYDAFFKRFTSPDPVVPDAGYGPSWNRYSYVYNNPLRYTDPSGHYPIGTDGSYYGFWGGLFAQSLSWFSDSTTRFFLTGDGRATLSNPAPIFRQSRKAAAAEASTAGTPIWATGIVDPFVTAIRDAVTAITQSMTGVSDFVRGTDPRVPECLGRPCSFNKNGFLIGSRSGPNARFLVTAPGNDSSTRRGVHIVRITTGSCFVIAVQHILDETTGKAYAALGFTSPGGGGSVEVGIVIPDPGKTAEDVITGLSVSGGTARTGFGPSIHLSVNTSGMIISTGMGLVRVGPMSACHSHPRFQKWMSRN